MRHASFVRCIHMSAALALSAAAVVATAQDTQPADQPAQNLAVNGAFEENIEPWAGMAVHRNGESRREARPDFVRHETEDTASDDSKGALRLVLDELGSGTLMAHQSGAQCRLTDEVSADHAVRVRFDAKRLAGSPHLRLTRANGGGSPRKIVELTDEWATHEVRVDLTHDTRTLIWALVEGDRGAASRRVNVGDVLIDNVRITAIEP